MPQGKKCKSRHEIREHPYNKTNSEQKTVTNGNNIVKTQYLDGFQYNKEVQSSALAGSFVKIFLKDFLTLRPPTAEGYVKATYISQSGYYKFNYVYNYTDHLGNIRLSYTKDPNTGELEVLEENHYYPFGLKHSKYDSPLAGIFLDKSSASSSIFIKPTPRNPYQYKYNGKEFQDELNLNLYDYGARNYDPAIGRWMNVDPLGEERSWLSPYNYVQNNPISRVDPTGMLDDWIEEIDADGNTTLTYDANVKTVEEAKAAGYDNATRVSEGFTVAYGGQQYSLTPQGSIESGGQIVGSNINVGGVDISTPMSFMSQWDGDRGFLGNWANSDNLLAMVSYGMVNDAYRTLKGLDGLELMGERNYNAFGILDVPNIDGSTNYENAAGSIANTMLNFVPVGKGAVLSKLKPLNAAQFSSTFKGTAISRAAPATRGYLNRLLNKLLNKSIKGPIQSFYNFHQTGGTVLLGTGVATTVGSKD